MQEISLHKLNDLFLDTIQRATTDLFFQDEEEIEYQLFEEFDIGIHSFLHADNLEKLYQGGFISKEIKNLSLELREKAIKALNFRRDASKVKSDSEWRGILELSDQIKKLKIDFDKNQ